MFNTIIKKLKQDIAEGMKEGQEINARVGLKMRMDIERAKEKLQFKKI